MTIGTQEEALKPIVKVTGRTQTDGLHCLGIDAGDAHVTVTSYPYDHRKGSNTGISIFGLTVDDLMSIGQDIIAEATRIQMEAK